MFRLQLRIAWIIVLVTTVSVATANSENGAITQWLYLGSFPADTINLALDRPFIQDEAHQMPDQGSMDRLSAYTWNKTETPSSGVLDFLSLHLPHDEYCVVYAATYIYSPTKRTAQLLIGSDDAVKIWLNDKEVHRNLVFRGLQPAQDRVTVLLAAGWNRLLAKVVNAGGGFGLIVQVVDAEGKPFPDVVFSNRKPANLRPIRLAAYPFIEKVKLGPSYVANNQRLFPIIVRIKNLGTSRGQSCSLTLIARRMKPKEKQFVLNDSAVVKFSLSAAQIKSHINKSIGLISFARGRKCDDQVIKPTPEMILQSIFSSPQLPIQVEVLRTIYANLSENIYWYEKFTGHPFEKHEETLVTIVNNALDGRWDRFLKNLEENFKELQQFSSVIKQDTLHMIGQSHIDMAWKWRWQETVEVCRRTFQSAIKFFDEIPDFKYIQSQAVAFQWMEEKYPDLFKAIQQKVKEGRFFLVGGMWVEPDLNLTGGEALVRQFLYGKRYFREKFGVDCITGYTPDTFGYTWTLPQILKKCGFKYFVTTKIRWNDTTKFPYSLFKWVSPDGSEVLTCFPMELNSDNDPESLADDLLEFKKEGLSDLPVLYGVGDHGGGPTRQHFERIKKMQSLAAYPTVYYNDLDSYMNRVQSKYPDVPTFRDELYLEFHRGTLTTQGLIKKRNRKSEIALEEAEKFAIFAQRPYPKDELDTAWKLTLFNQFHDILPGSSIPEVYIDANKDYDRIQEITSAVIDTSLRQIVSRIKLKHKDVAVVVFNPTSWDRTDVVEVEIPQGLSVKQVVDSRKQKMPFQQTGNRLVFIARDVPQNGYKTFRLKKGKAKKQKNSLIITQTSLENPFFKIEINPGNGNIRRFFDKRANREVLAAGQEGNILQFFEDRPTRNDAWNIGYTGKSWVCEKVEGIEIVETGPARAVLRYTRIFNNSRFTQDYIIYPDVPRLDIRNQVDWHEHHVLAKAAFPVNVSADSATFEIAYGSIRRTTHPQTPAEKAKFEVSAHKYVDLSQDDYGVALLNDCKYGHDVKDNMMRITLLRSPQTPSPINRPPGYVNPFVDQGQHEFVYSVYPHAGDGKKALTVRRGYELNYPLLPVVSTKHKGSLPAMHSFVKVSPDNIVLTVVKKAEDTDERVVRLYEVNGQETRANLQFDNAIQKAWLANLLEEKGEALTVQNNSVTFPVKPYEIVTLVVQ